MLTVRTLTWDSYHHYISIMHIHRSLICSSTQSILLPPINLIRISFRSSCYEISELPNRTIYVTINQHISLSSNSSKVARLHTDLATLCVDI